MGRHSHCDKIPVMNFWWNWLKEIMSDSNKGYDLAPDGHLLSLLWAWYREYGRRTLAYERRTLVMQRASETDSGEVARLTAELKKSNDAEQSALDRANK